jgi:hypothetical protein
MGLGEMQMIDDSGKVNRYIVDIENLKFLKESLKSEHLQSKISVSEIENKIYKNNHFTNKIFVDLTRKEVNLLLDELTYLFTNEGLQTNSEPNRLGLEIERLIDIFYQQSI